MELAELLIIPAVFVVIILLFVLVVAYNMKLDLRSQKILVEGIKTTGLIVAGRKWNESSNRDTRKATFKITYVSPLHGGKKNSGKCVKKPRLRLRNSDSKYLKSVT